MNFGGRRRQREESVLDLTAMLDVVFQLVLFLVLSTQLDPPKDKEFEEAGQKIPGVEVDLPKSAAQNSLSDSRSLNVWLTTQGSLFLDDQAIDRVSLKRAFHQAAQDDKSILVIVKADRDVSHGRVVEVMELARVEGLTRLAFATTDENKQNLP